MTHRHNHYCGLFGGPYMEKIEKVVYILTYLLTYLLTYILTYLLTYSIEQSSS